MEAGRLFPKTAYERFVEKPQPIRPVPFRKRFFPGWSCRFFLKIPCWKLLKKPPVQSPCSFVKTALPCSALPTGFFAPGAAALQKALAGIVHPAVGFSAFPSAVFSRRFRVFNPAIEVRPGAAFSNWKFWKISGATVSQKDAACCRSTLFKRQTCSPKRCHFPKTRAPAKRNPFLPREKALFMQRETGFRRPRFPLGAFCATIEKITP